MKGEEREEVGSEKWEVGSGKEGARGSGKEEGEGDGVLASLRHD